jgi:putative ATPase
MKELGYGEDYRYAHDEEDAFAAGENYFPGDMPTRRYYDPVPRGLELQIREKLAKNAEKTSLREKRHRETGHREIRSDGRKAADDE